MELPVVDAEEDALRELGRETDMAEGRVEASEGAQKPEPPAPPAEDSGKPQPTPEKQPDSSESGPEKPPQPEKADEKRDELGRFKAQADKDEKAAPNGEKAPSSAPSAVTDEPPADRSKYAQAKERDSKDKVRQERSWTALQREKEEFRAQQAQWEQERHREQLQAQAQAPPLQKSGIDLNGYLKAYQDFRQSGDWENAARSLETVLELEAQGKQYSERQQQAQYELAWRNDMDAAIAKHPELQSPDHPFYQEVDRIVKQEPYLFYIPGGFHKAVELATIVLAAGSDSELREENEKLRARLEQLEHSSQPARGGPGRPPQGPKRQEDMSLDEEESFLRDLTSREDAAMRR